MLEESLRALSLFVVLATLLIFAELPFGSVLSQLEPSEVRLIARSKLRHAVSVLVRTRRARTGHRPWFAFAGVAAVAAIRTAVASIGAVILALFIWSAMSTLIRNGSNTVNSWAYGLVIIGLACLLGPIGLLRATDRIGRVKSTTKSTWPPPLPHDADATVSGAHYKVSVALYRHYLRGILLMMATLVTIAGIPDRGAQNDSIVALLQTLIPVLLVLSAGGLTIWAIWSSAARLRTLAHITTFLDLRPQSDIQPFTLALGTDPFLGARRYPGIDPHRSRAQLVAIVMAVERYARSIEHRQQIDLRHPVAHALALETAELRAYLSQPKSFTSTVADEAIDSLHHIVVLLVGSTPEYLQATEARLAHLADHAAPAPIRRSWSARISSAVDLTDRTVRSATYFLIVVITLWLFVTGQASIEEMVNRIS